MVISKNTQLGLRLHGEIPALLDAMKSNHTIAIGRLDSKKSEYNRLIAIMESDGHSDEDKEFAGAALVKMNFTLPFTEGYGETRRSIIDRISSTLPEHAEHGEFAYMMHMTLNTDGVKHFLICDSVYRAAELIRIGENFTARVMKTIKPGAYIYLMGKNRMVKFHVVSDALFGFFFDKDENIAFEFWMDLDSGLFGADSNEIDSHREHFSRVVQVMTFIELGDTEVLVLDGGRNNGKPKSEGKITNSDRNTVYVVDSTWNTLIVRTEGFGVRGHFKLQPCGSGLIDRKLIWINSFMKHGYTRRPKARILGDGNA